MVQSLLFAVMGSESCCVFLSKTESEYKRTGGNFKITFLFEI